MEAIILEKIFWSDFLETFFPYLFPQKVSLIICFLRTVKFIRTKFFLEPKKMGFNLSAFSYIVALISDAFLIFFSIFHVIAFDELRTDYKNPIDQCNSLNPVSSENYFFFDKSF